MSDIFEALGASSLGSFMAGNPLAFPVAETIHVVAITTVLGLILIVDLRLIGLASATYPVSRLTRTLLPSTWIAFVLAAVSGFLLFSSNPSTYAGNFAFRVKFALLAAAGVNMLVFHFLTMRGIEQWDNEARAPNGVRAAGLISLVIWILVVGFGRWVGFTMAPF